MSNYSWQKFIEHEQQKAYFKNLEQFLASEEAEGKVLYPPKALRYSAFELCAFEKTKVVILGQDPYHGDDNGVIQAHGLAFSVPSGVKKLPPSLKNIYKELADDVGCDIPSSGDLSSWAQQGVLLINAVMSVEASCANAHKNRGWENFSDAVIKKLSDEKEMVVFVLWGSYAQKKRALIDSSKHVVISSAHPSPLSAYRGFFGSKPFSHINSFLQKHQYNTIDWCLK